VSQSTGSGRTLTLIVGSDWSGARKVTIGGGGGTPGSASNPAPTSADTQSCVG
jgi:hypothetical protein